MSTKSIILMIQFNVERLSSKDVLSIFKTHPAIIERNQVYKTPLYLQSEVIIDRLEKEVRNLKF